MFVRVVLQVAVRAAGGGAGSGAEVIALLIGDVGRIHRVAEFTAELRRTSPMHDARENTDENNADDDADETDAGKIPNAVLFHLGAFC